MSYAFIKRLSAIALPVALLVATFVALQKVQLLSAAQRELALFAPYLALSVGLVLSLAFNRGRVFLTLLITGLFYLFTRSYPPGAGDYVAHTVYVCSSVLIPLNLCLFCFMRERGIFTHSGRMRLGFVAAQVIVLYWIARFPQDYAAIPEMIARPLVQSAWLDSFAMPQSGQLLFLIAGVVISIRALKRRPIDVALLGTVVALAIALDLIDVELVPALFVTSAVLLLIIGVLQDSHSMAFYDDLTGLPSRRALNEQMLGLGRRRYVVAMVDVDHFKRFNDTYGHDVGDQVLKMVGSKIAAVRGGGKPFRYGGEEFTVIFPRKDMKEVTPHLEELRQAIAGYQLWIRGADRPKESEVGKNKRSGGAGGSGKSVSVTVSIGVAASGDDLRNAAEVIKAADRALYRAKQRGRNQIAS